MSDNKAEIQIPNPYFANEIDVLPLSLLENHPYFKQLDNWNKRAAQEASQLINLLTGEGYIEPGKLRSIFEFGSGIGASTLAFVELAKFSGADLEVVERRPHQAKTLIEAEILPFEKIHIEDGVELLEEAAHNGQRFDLIAAFMFGPDYLDKQTEGFLQKALSALSEEGTVAIYSDFHTMERVLGVCKRFGVNYNQLSRVLIENGPHRTIVIIPKPGLELQAS
jgi:predicted O-methyltransferase YrrM